MLPVVNPEAGWSDLEIADGMAAAMAYENALQFEDESERVKTFNQLRGYCRQDTLAMVQLYQALNEIADNNEGER